MLKDVIVSEKTNKTEVKIKPINLKILFDKNSAELIINQNTNLMVNGDFCIGATGELSLLSKNNMHFDSLNSKIYFNSRLSKKLKNLPESIEYRNKQKKIQLHQKEELQEEYNNLLEKISKLEKEIKDLKNAWNS